MGVDNMYLHCGIAFVCCIAWLWGLIFGALWVSQATDIESTHNIRLGVGITLIVTGAILCPISLLCMAFAPFIHRPMKGGRPYNVQDGKPLLISTSNKTLDESNSSSFLDNNDYVLDIENDDDAPIIIDENMRRLLVDEYRSAGIAEYLSIASFNKFSLELVSICAPSFLIELAYKAGLDEIKHAKYSFQIANYFNNLHNDQHQILVPNNIKSHNLNIDNDINNICLETINDGCFEETVSAFTIYHQYKYIKDYLVEGGDKNNDGLNVILERISSILLEIVNDEIKHSALAWISVKWMMLKSRNDRNINIDANDRDWWDHLLNHNISKNSYNLTFVDELRLGFINLSSNRRFGILSGFEQMEIAAKCYKYVIKDLIQLLFSTENEDKCLESIYDNIVRVLQNKILFEAPRHQL